MRLSYRNLDSNPETLESVSSTFLHHQAQRVAVRLKRDTDSVAVADAPGDGA